MEVHRQIGCGFQEVIYQRALAIEFRLTDIFFEREKSMSIFYKEESIGERRVDFLVENGLLVELKAVEQTIPVHFAQAINYCEAFELPHGLLLNFGSSKLQFNRVFNNRLTSKWEPE